MRICRDHALPLPAVSVPLLGYEVDFLWPAARFVVEADGGDHLNPGRRDHDNDRDIASAGPATWFGDTRAARWADEDAVAAEVLRSSPSRGLRPSADRDHALDRDPRLARRSPAGR